MSDTPDMLRVGVVQMRCSDDREQNTMHAEVLVREAAERGADIVCLPELFQTRYFCQTENAANFRFAEPVPGPTTDRFSALASSYGISIYVSLFEKRTTGLYHNTTAFISPKRGYVGKYRKMHIPDDPGFYEKFYFAPGDLGFAAFAEDGHKSGILICWDQWYPEAARATALRGADVIFYPTAIGWHPDEKADLGEQQHDAWETAQRAHAIANGIFVVAVNRVGFEPAPEGETMSGGIEFWGQSFVAAPDGTVVYRAPADEETVEVVELDLSRIEFQRHGWPFLRDRRVDAYSDLTRRYVDD